jgi:(S)-sulfolactate dehydrogenase
MARIVISELMDAAAVEGLARDQTVLYDPELVDRREELLAAVGGAEALIVRNRTRVDAELLAAAAALRVVGRLGVGLDNIDLEACRARGIAVHPATGANDVAVAEYVIAAILLLLRGAFGATASVLEGRWPREASIGREAMGRTLGLVGYGRIAREVAARARALGMAIAAFDPFLGEADPAWAAVVRHSSLEGLLATADVVSLHVPLTAETRGLLDARRIAAMRPGAILVNTARGPVVEAAAVAAALRAGRLAGAALDVFEEEPPSAEAARVFAGCPNLILTPHVAGITVESNVRVSAMVAEAVRRVLEGG